MYEVEERIEELKSDILKSYEKLEKYKPVNSLFLKIGIVMVVVLVLTSSFLPCFRKVKEEIDLKYNQNLVEGNYCYMDVSEAVYMGTVESVLNNTSIALDTTAYFKTVDSDGEDGIICVKGDADIQKFVEKLDENMENVRCYGTIVEPPDDLHISVEDAMETSLDEAMENTNIMQDFLTMYKIMESGVDIPKTKTVTKPGVGLIFLVSGVVSFLARSIVHSRIMSESNNIKRKAELLTLLQQKEGET